MRFGGSSDWLVSAGGAASAASPCIEIERGQPQAWRVTLLPLRRPDGRQLDTNIGDLPRAKIEYGLDAISTTTEVDWPCQGQSFDLTCATLRVSGLATPGAALPGGSASQALQFRAWAAPVHTCVQEATVTVPVGSIPTDQDSAVMAVPAGARSMVLWADSTGGVSVTLAPEAMSVTFAGPTPQFATVRYEHGAAPSSMFAQQNYGIAVPSGAQSFSVLNPPTVGAGTLYNVWAQFFCRL